MKLTYDIINTFQNTIERIVAIAVALLTLVLGVAAVGVLAFANAAALWLAWVYLI